MSTRQTLFVPSTDICVGDQIVSVKHTVIGTVSAVTPDYGLANSTHVEFSDDQRVPPIDFERTNIVCILRELQPEPRS